jgi:PAS domain S-box-containing protein
MSNTSTAKLRVLLVAKDPADVFLLREMVNEEPHSRFVVGAEADSLAGATARLSAGGIHAVLLDLELADSRGVDTFTAFHKAAPDLPVVILSDQEDEEVALQTVQFGAQEYLVKGRIVPHLLHRALRYAVERARADAQLAHERELLGMLLENIPDRIYFKDRRSRFIRINRALTEFFGLASPEAAYGRTDGDFFDPEAARQMLEDEMRIMETGQPILGKVEAKTLTSGEISWTLTTKLPLRDREGRIVGTCGISREITAIKTMEEQLATERHLLRALIDNLPDLVFLKDAEGRYLLDNAAHLRFLGASEFSEVNGRTPFDFFPDPVASVLHEEDMAVIRSGQPVYDHEQKAADAGGHVRWLLTTKIPWLSEGRAVGLVSISRDVSLQKLAELHLKQANADLKARREDLMAAVRDLQEAHRDLRSTQLQLVDAEKMKSVGRLAAGVAHEVKNPLAILKMGLEYISTLQLEDETAPVILKEMSDALQRADTVIRGLLDFSAPKQLEVGRASINVIINQALRLVRGEMKRGCQVRRELQEDLPQLALDADKISQVFVNLFTNSIHAMSGGGTLTVRTYSKQLTGVGSNIADQRSESFRVGETIVVAEIDDTGPGIPEDKLAKVFEPFFTTKPTGQGTGLGLSVVKTIIDLHGGTIDLRNLPEGGARVTIMFQA